MQKDHSTSKTVNDLILRHNRGVKIKSSRERERVYKRRWGKGEGRGKRRIQKGRKTKVNIDACPPPD